MTRFLQIGLCAVSLGAFGSALAQAQLDDTDTRTDTQKRANDTAGQIVSAPDSAFRATPARTERRTERRRIGVT